jgi:hypothetical protein
MWFGRSYSGKTWQGNPKPVQKAVVFQDFDLIQH